MKSGNTRNPAPRMRASGDRLPLLCLLLSLLAASLPAAATGRCPTEGVVLQVLGSGGPELYPDRAATGYLLWQGGRARLLIDAGGGVMQNFVRAGARIEDLEAVLFTHLHVDHSADLPVLVKASFFGGRDRPLPLYGPEGNAVMPAMTAFTVGLFGPRGVYRYLSDFLLGDSAGYQLEPHDVPLQRRPRVVWEGAGLRLSAVAVHHGPLPALAWRVDAGGRSVTISGDMNGDWHTLEQLSAGSDLLVAHHAVPEEAAGVARALHMPPSVIGAIAGAAGVKRLVLSHRMHRSLGNEEASLAAIRRHYGGPVDFARDLSCYPL